jgi:CheY-like chemotaxis protein
MEESMNVEFGSGLRFAKPCIHCDQEFDLVAAEWCGCLTRETTFSCPHCAGCACNAGTRARNEFWMAAPTVLWERRRAEQKLSASRLQLLKPESVSRPFAIVIDDEPHLLRAANRVLSGLGFTTLTSERPLEALAIARNTLPDLILTDALMPRLDGRELCRQLKSDPLTRQIRIIVMSSLYKGTVFRNEAFSRFLVDAFLEKPVSAETLAEVVRRLIPDTYALGPGEHQSPVNAAMHG